MPLRRSPRFIALLVLVTVLGPLSMQMFLPALPAVQNAFGTDASTVQLTITLAMVAIGVATLLFGPLSDRFGRKPVLLAGIVLFLAGSVASALADSADMLIVSRVIQAGGASAGIVLARAMARDVYGFERSVRVISYLSMVMVVAPTVSPVIGGVVTDAFGWRAIFWAMTALAAVSLVGVWAGLPETHGAGAQAGWSSLIVGSRNLMRSRLYVGYMLILSAAFSVFFAFLAAAPYLTAEVLHLPARDYGLWFMPVAGVFIISTFLATRVIDRFGAHRLIRTGAIASLIVTLVSLPLYYWLPLSAPLLFAPMTMISFIQGFMIPNAQASAINVNPRFAGAASGLIGFVPMVTSAIVAQTVAVLADGSVLPMLCFMTGAAVLGVLFLPMLGKGPRPPAPSTA